MLYIVGGASRSGKSIVAQELLEREHIPFFSIDFLMMGFAKGLPEYGVDPNESCDKVALKLWPVVKGIMNNIIDIDAQYLIEGDALLPSSIHMLQEERKGKRIKACFLGYSNASSKDKLRSIRSYRGGLNDWIQEYSDEEIRKHVNSMLDYSNFLKEECSKYSIAYFDTSENFESMKIEIVKYLTKD